MVGSVKGVDMKTKPISEGLADMMMTKLGPCPTCGDFIKPCHCKLNAEIADLQKTIRALKVGNTYLLEALMNMAQQYLATEDEIDSTVHHQFISAGENALSLLQDAGMARTDDNVEYVLLWGKLEERKRGLGIK
jgi:hypothetical protein